jgi:hypothetical protein
MIDAHFVKDAPAAVPDIYACVADRDMYVAMLRREGAGLL